MEQPILDKTKLFRRAAIDGKPAKVNTLEGIIDGYPVVFNVRADIGGLFYEIIDEHALDDADLSDIKFLVNHNNDSMPIARHRRGKRSTMDISIDNIGLKTTARVDVENNTNSRAVCSAVDRGDVEDMSFAFAMFVSGEEWFDLDKPMPTRRITKIARIPEISVVNDGAYSQTSISARSTEALDNEKKALDNARSVALDNENRTKESERAQAALRLEKEKFLFIERSKLL